RPCKRRSSTPASGRCGTGRAPPPRSAEPWHISTNEEPLILTQELSFGRPPDDVRCIKTPSLARRFPACPLKRPQTADLAGPLIGPGGAGQRLSAAWRHNWRGCVND